MAAYYNEFDPFAAAWLRELIKAGHIAPGEVDERSIVDVKADELRGFTQHHFFAGIGTWSYALRRSGWSDERPVWTGSPPCQPFSVAGNRKGKDDERHLAPHWLELVSEFGPAVVFGEQVDAAIRHGWLDDLQDALERENYATGAIVLPGCSIGSPHIRQRIWFVAERLADAERTTKPRHGSLSREGICEQEAVRPAGVGNVDNMETVGSDARVLHARENGRLADTGHDERRGRDTIRHSESEYGQTSSEVQGSGADAPDNYWRDSDWLYCRDGKWRPVMSSPQQMADGSATDLVRVCSSRGGFYSPLTKDSPNRVGRLRGYGNGIIAPLAQAFIETYMDV